MAINLHTKYAEKIVEAFKKNSLLKGILKAEYSFIGNKTVAVSTLTTVPMGNYDRTAASNRYGTPTEVQDTVQELTLTQDRGFALVIDKGNNTDQNGIKNAGKMLKLQIKEQMIPDSDKYGFARLCQLAGKVAGNSTALTKETICGKIDDGVAYLDDAEVPEEGRYLFLTGTIFKYLKQSGADLSSDEVARRAWVKGQVAEYSGMRVIKVPAGRWPANVNFIIVHEKAGCFPEKLNETKLHKDPPGYSGNLLEGRHYYDLFILGTHCDGVYVEVCTAEGKGTVCAAPAIDTDTGGLTSSTDGATIKFTTDGTDPRYSRTAKTGTASDVTADDTVVKAYAYMAGAYPSAVTTAVMGEVVESGDEGGEGGEPD